MHANDLVPDWLQGVLRRQDLIGDDVRVLAATTRPIGTGQVADSHQIELTYSEPGAGPATLVAKVTSESVTSRAAGRSELNYVREVRFYQEIAPRLQVRVPVCLHAEIDSNNTEFVILFEDLSPARQGDQLVGCTLEETQLAVQQAARLHAPFWGSDDLRGVPWLDISATYWPRFAEMMPGWYAGFRDRYSDRVPAEDLQLGQEFVDRIDAFYSALRAMPFTVQHGDFRPDNVLFDAKDGEVPLAVLDWQTVILAPGVVDVAYFVGGALQPDVRRQAEPELLRLYHQELVRLGVRDYDLDRLRRDYAFATFQNLVIGVAAAMLVQRSDRGDDLFVSMMTSSVAHARDHGALSLLVSEASVSA